jgi:hypothetical protein
MGLPLSTSRSKWAWRDSAPTFSSPTGGFGSKVSVLVLVLELGFGVYISELGFRWFVFWESWAHVWESHCEGVCFWRSALGMSIGVWGEGFRILGLEFGLEFFVVGFRVQG